MKALVFDIETDGLLDTLTRVHSLVIEDPETGELFSHFDSSDSDWHIARGLKRLMEADLIIGHNIIKFDIPAIQKAYPWFKIDQAKVFDTLVASRLIWTNITDTDLSRIKKGKTTLPTKLAGKHGLEAWGHRLGRFKGDYKTMMEAKGLDPWASWNPEMQSYCEDDVHLNVELWKLIVSKEYSPDALRLEHKIAFIMARMERQGFGFDVMAAERLYVELAGKREELAGSLRSLFQPWYVRDGKGVMTPKRDNRRMGYGAGCPFTKVKLTVFNPNSRQHIADRLMRVRGWKPTQFTDGGQPKVDDAILEDLDYPEAKALAEYMMLQKRIGQLAEGDNAWLKLVTAQGTIHGSINPNGAVTGRATHSYPNIAQVPKVQATKEKGLLKGIEGGYGYECRSLFRPITRGWVQLGCDVSGLELRMLGHFMARYDGGDYGREVVNGDIHSLNQEAAGLPSRDQAKTFIYAFLYGAGDEKIGKIISRGREAGRAIKRAFFKKVPALKRLIEGVQSSAKRKGWINGLDGRQLHIRSAHAALNTLLQSAGALVCKQWIIEFDDLLTQHDLHGFVNIMAWVHDELQMEVHPDYAQRVGELCVEAIVLAGKFFNIQVPLTGEFKIGQTWKDCH